MITDTLICENVAPKTQEQPFARHFSTSKLPLTCCEIQFEHNLIKAVFVI